MARAPLAARVRSRSTSSDSSDVLRSLASNERVQVVVLHADADDRAEQGTATGVIPRDRSESTRQLAGLRGFGGVVVDFEQSPPHVAPHEVAGRAAEVLRFAPRHRDAPGDEVTNNLGDEPRLATARFTRNSHKTSGIAEHVIE